MKEYDEFHNQQNQLSEVSNLVAKVKKRHKKTFLCPKKCKRAVYLFEKGISTKNVMRDLQVSEKSIRRIRKQYEQTGKVTPTIGEDNKKYRSEWKNNEISATKTALLEIVRSNCALSLGGMKEELQKLGIKKQTSTIHKYLKELRYSRKKLRKVPIQRNTKQKLIYRQKYCQMISQIPLQNLIFLDETSFNQHTSLYFGWAPKGEQPSIHIPANKKQTISLVAAISIKGFQATKIIRGPVSNKHICEFLEHYLDHLQPHEVLVLDNARVHHAASVKQKIAELKRAVRYLPAYTPQLNPIENIFSEIKGQFMRRRNHSEMKVVQIEKLIEDSVRGMKTKNFRKYFQHYTQWVKKGQSGELFI